jgi:hypothetical protein
MDIGQSPRGIASYFETEANFLLQPPAALRRSIASVGMVVVATIVRSGVQGL